MLLMLIFYFHLVSGSLGDASALRNLTIRFRKFIDGIDPTLVFGSQSDAILAHGWSTPFSDHSLRRVKRQSNKAKGKTTKKETSTTQESIPAKNRRIKVKMFDMMQQFMYSGQERLWPVSHVLERYQSQTPFRMAFVFGQLELLTHEANSIMSYLEQMRQNREKKFTVTQTLQIYWSLVVKNMDVTYLVDYINGHVTPKDRLSQLKLQILRKEKENIEKMMLGRTQGHRRGN